jgi:hypothetical protein
MDFEQRLERYVRFIAKLCVVIYVLGYTLGSLVHKANDQLTALVRLPRRSKVQKVQRLAKEAFQCFLAGAERLVSYAGHHLSTLEA